ncbi:MAG: hypothetical protein KAY59_11465 [Acidobacteria bacterium]|nr:hypothetical protein [Acidobacteriota bacterium]MDQ1292050.1 hypothetical protein [Nitrospirota bacterium]
MADEPLTGEAVWFAHERRIQRLEEGMSDLGRAMVKVEQDIQKNVQLTGQIRDDTREIRDLVRGGKVLGRLIVWGGGFVGLLVSLYAIGVLGR